MELPPEKQKEFIADVRSILVLQDRRRSAMHVLENRMRGLGWKGWTNFTVFAQLCRDVGFHVYEGMGRRNRRAHFVAIDPAPDAEPDYFAEIGFVIAVRAGVWINRSNPAGETSVRAAARIWKTQRGVDKYRQRPGYDGATIQHTRDLDDGAA